ncbi:hypothetical protein LX36DRAFT_663368 [Colletotrichum falcatum]|nr:hypothetical protein LX36DRAFT_663368 [Colletotrichum falcatum]
MKYFSLLLLCTLVHGLLVPTGLADIPSDHGLLERGVRTQCDYHCKQGVSTACRFVLSDDGVIVCTRAPPRPPSLRYYKHIASAAERAGVRLLPNTFYYFQSCAREQDYGPTHVEEWIMRQTEGCYHVGLIIGKTNTDNTAFEATYIDTHHYKKPMGWIIIGEEWKGPKRIETILYRGKVEPGKADTMALMTEAAEWKQRSKDEKNIAYNSLTMYNTLALKLQ